MHCLHERGLFRLEVSPCYCIQYVLVYKCSLRSKILLELVVIIPQLYCLIVFSGARVFASDIARVGRAAWLCDISGT